MPSLSWRCQVFLLLIYICCLFPPADCNFFNKLGNLTVEQSVPFLMGSDLTLHCQINDCKHLPHTYLYFEKREVQNTVLPWKFDGCTATFNLTNVREPDLNVFCKTSDQGTVHVVTGISLRSGLPPDKAQNIICETTRNAHFINCKWYKGQKTHVPTTYNISVTKESGSLTYSQQFEDADNCSIPKEPFDASIKYHLSIMAHNVFGETHSDPLTFYLSDVVIPEIPHITHINFRNQSPVAFLQWNTSESIENLQPFIRRRTIYGHWEEGHTKDLGDSLTVKVSGLKPLTDYEFQVKTCSKQVQETDANPSSFTKTVCGKWSQSFWTKTPAKGPSEPLCVWRASVMTINNGQQIVTVFWKPPPADDFSGEIQHYEIFFGDGQKQEIICSSLSQCSARVPLLRPISVTAVTSNGTSPPATVPLTQSDAPGPVWRAVTPAVDGSSVTVSWAPPLLNEELLNYVTEWTTVPSKDLLWQTVSRHQSEATVTGLESGVLYNISVYAVTTRGASAPSSSLVYSKELKPVCGPVLSVLVHESKRVLVQWTELPVEQRRGHITSYTVYYKVFNSSSSQLSVNVPVPGPKQKWLDCPEGALILQMSASTAAGEGPKGNRISSHPPAPPVGLVIVVIFIITFFIAIIVNLMCWKCVRKRVKQKCIAWGPEWLGDHLPKLINSNAIKLLQSDRSELSLITSYSDPPLSPISFLEEKEELYPCVHVESGLKQTDTTSAEPESTADIFSPDSTVDCNYKPQINAFSFAETEDIKNREEEKSSSFLFEGCMEGLLSSVQVDLSGGQAGPGLDTVNCLWWLKTDKFNIDMMEIRTSTDKVDTKSDLSLPDSEVSSDEASVVFSDNNEGDLTGGYFPQLFSRTDDTASSVTHLHC